MCDGLNTKLEARLYAVLVTFLTTFASSVTLYDLYVDPSLDGRSLWTQKLHAFLFGTLVMLSLICYFLCYGTKPGSADEWVVERPDLIEVVDDSRALGIDEEVGREGQMCRICQQPKPPRTHHCSTCNRCVLRMDHHCPWVGNCVGYKNQKFFILYLLYTAFSAAYASILLVQFLVHCQLTPRGLSGHELVLAGVFTPFAILISIFTFIGVSSIFGWNVFLLIRNQTTVEYQKCNSEDTDSKPVELRSYSRGMASNVRHIMGGNPWLWLVPYRECRGLRRKQRS